MRDNSHKLNLFQPFFFLLIFALVMAVLFFGLASLSNERKNSVYQTYASETTHYINQNQSQLVILFNQIFPKADCVIQRQPNLVCAFPNQDAIAHLLPSTLKDWSSTAFIKEDGERMLIMRLSGDTKEIYVYPEQKRLELQKLLRGEIEKISWDNYSYDLSGKEVVIPVKDGNKVIGAIMRAVIETQ